MDFLQMRYYLCIYEYRNITKASKNLFISQQRLSHVLKKIEDELGGIKLFHRTQGGLVPTESGQIVYDTFKDILEKYNTLTENLSNESLKNYKHSLRVVLDIGVGEILSSHIPMTFSKTYPDIQLYYNEHRINNCKKLVNEGKSDMGLSVNIGWSEHFIKKEICAFHTYVILYNNHPLSEKMLLTARDLEKYPLILGGAVTYYTYLQDFELNQVVPNIILSVNDFETSISYVRKKEGIFPILYDLRRGKPDIPSSCSMVPYKTSKPALLYAYWKENSKNQKQIDYFVDFLISELKE